MATPPNLIGVAKVSGNAIPPPRVLADQGRVGFADQVLDSDGQVRRALLTVEASDTKQIRESLRLAPGYLAQRQITPQPLDAAETTIQLGRTVVAPGYRRANTGGYQLLLNYLGGQTLLDTFPLETLLAGEVPATAIVGRLVLPGLTAESGEPLFQTPYSNRLAGTPPRLAGVTI